MHFLLVYYFFFTEMQKTKQVDAIHNMFLVYLQMVYECGSEFISVKC